mmetsp:Transcript_16754/g.33520  ORF Transcript_16754/g.33520 Transcript_16754/m.33520 type:complete len:202 (+) Transcript_16754:290-895(+)
MPEYWRTLICALVGQSGPHRPTSSRSTPHRPTPHRPSPHKPSPHRPTPIEPFWNPQVFHLESRVRHSRREKDGFSRQQLDEKLRIWSLNQPLLGQEFTCWESKKVARHRCRRFSTCTLSCVMASLPEGNHGFMLKRTISLTELGAKGPHPTRISTNGVRNVKRLWRAQSPDGVWMRRQVTSAGRMRSSGCTKQSRGIFIAI